MKQTAVEWLIVQMHTHWINEDVTFQTLLEQAKEMEKEQMIKFAEFVATYPDKNKNAKGDILHAKSKYDGAERTYRVLA
jgi:hypothetical protein